MATIKDKKENKKTIKRFLQYYKPYKGLCALDLIAAFVSSILAIFFPSVTRELLKNWIPNKAWDMMIYAFAAMFAVYAFQSVLAFIRMKWGHILGTRMEGDMRRDLFDHLQTLSFSYFDKSKTGQIMSRMTNDLFQIAEAAHHGPEDFLISICTLIVSYFIMFSYNTYLASISLVIIPLMFTWGFFQGHKMKMQFKTVRRVVGEVNSTVENSLLGIKEVKSFTSEVLQAEKFGKSNKTLVDNKSVQYNIMARYHAIIGLLRNLYYWVVVVFGAVLMYFNHLETYDLVAFILFVSVVLAPIDRMIQFVEELQQGMASFERFTDIMDIKPEINDEKDAKDLIVTKGKIEYKDVSFSYDNKDGEVLGKVSLVIEPATKVAFVGESGAGKTTVASLLPRFYEVTSGKILIDGQDITKVTQKSLRSGIGFVQQNVFLFDGSIRENLRYGNYDATDEQMWDALEGADLADFVRQLPEGLTTQVGERGTRLSGGQKQRLSIARVFLKNPKILIFDEATSSLDSESEAQIQAAFERLSKGRTAIMIAHRLTTIRDANKIFVVNKGKIVESGDHDSLIKLNGQYAKLYKRQEV
ncbi:MAG: ABC transporter ATP-binding protein [Sphaerochaetaceae bacterium]